MNKIYQFIFATILISLILPNLVFASWWNPFSWFIKKNIPANTEIVNIATSTETIKQATSSARRNKRMVTSSSTAKKVQAKIEAVTSDSNKVAQQKAEEQARIDLAVKTALDKQLAEYKAEQENIARNKIQEEETRKRLAEEDAARQAENQAKVAPIIASYKINDDVTNGGDVKVGTLDKTVWSATISVDSEKEVYLDGLTLEVVGSIPSDGLRNIKLYIAGSEVASVDGLNSNNEIIFKLLTPYVINSKKLEVAADIQGGETRSFSVDLYGSSKIQLRSSDPNKNVFLTGNAVSGRWNILGESIH